LIKTQHDACRIGTRLHRQHFEAPDNDSCEHQNEVAARAGERNPRVR
jgi:hypothetical protein